MLYLGRYLSQKLGLDLGSLAARLSDGSFTELPVRKEIRDFFFSSELRFISL